MVGGEILKPRFLLFLIGIFFIIIIVIALSASSGGTNPLHLKGKAEVIINGDAGIATVRITNQNENTAITATAADLPFTFTCSKGDRLAINVTVLSDYMFNAWKFKDGTFNNHNPLLTDIDKDTEMTADCIARSDLTP